MKKLTLITLFLAGLSFAAAAQSKQQTDPWPTSIVSKEVNKMQHRKKTYTPSTVVAGNAEWVISKGVARRSGQPTTTGLVKLEGHPTWFVSKGVARMQAER